MSETLTFYMHTLDGKPAFFDGWQVCPGFQGGRHRSRQPLAISIGQIKAEQRASQNNRKMAGYSDLRFDYGYVRVHAEVEP